MWETDCSAAISSMVAPGKLMLLCWKLVGGPYSESQLLRRSSGVGKLLTMTNLRVDAVLWPRVSLARTFS